MSGICGGRGGVCKLQAMNEMGERTRNYKNARVRPCSSSRSNDSRGDCGSEGGGPGGDCAPRPSRATAAAATADQIFAHSPLARKNDRAADRAAAAAIVALVARSRRCQQAPLPLTTLVLINKRRQRAKRAARGLTLQPRQPPSQPPLSPLQRSNQRAYKRDEREHATFRVLQRSLSRLRSARAREQTSALIRREARASRRRRTTPKMVACRLMLGARVLAARCSPPAAPLARSRRSVCILSTIAGVVVNIAKHERRLCLHKRRQTIDVDDDHDGDRGDVVIVIDCECRRRRVCCCCCCSGGGGGGGSDGSGRKKSKQKGAARDCRQTPQSLVCALARPLAGCL